MASRCWWATSSAWDARDESEDFRAGSVSDGPGRCSCVRRGRLCSSQSNQAVGAASQAEIGVGADEIAVQEQTAESGEQRRVGQGASSVTANLIIREIELFQAAQVR